MEWSIYVPSTGEVKIVCKIVVRRTMWTPLTEHGGQTEHYVKNILNRSVMESVK